MRSAVLLLSLAVVVGNVAVVAMVTPGGSKLGYVCTRCVLFSSVDAVACARSQFVLDRDYLHHVTAPGLRANRPEQVGNNLMGLGKVLLEGSALPPKIEKNASLPIR